MNTELAAALRIDDLVDAAAILIDLFGLGDRAEPFDVWPVDDGDRVITATVSGAADLVVYLAVNEEVSQRLLHDPGRLTSGLGEAVRAVVGPEAELVVSDVELTEETPATFVALFDGPQLCALFGVTPIERAAMDDAAGEVPGAAGGMPGQVGAASGPGLDASGAAAPFEPAMLQGAIDGVAVGAGPLELLHDVEMEVTVELGRTRLPIRELLTLQPGMVVEIDRAAGAPIDVLVNGRRIASGEVVVVDEEFGVRIVEIVSSHD